ncbi:MAG: CaiB/BaiF CoA transferase family protein [Candidatus Binatia bacterium]
MNVALEGVVVLDLTRQFWGCLASAMLGDFGARVIRLEKPDGSDRVFPDNGDVPSRGSWNYRFDLANRNKLSLALDLDLERGLDLARRLVAEVDVLVTDMPATVLTGYGLDYGSASAIRPDIVYVGGSGFGPRGPDRDLPAIDELAAARTGMMPILPQPDEPPVYPGHGQIYTTVMMAFGAVTALYHRRESGEGQEINASLLAGNMYGASLDLQAYLAIRGDRFLQPVSRLDAGNPMSGTQYPTEDGMWVTLTMPDTDRWWPALAEIVGLDADDSRFDSHDKRCGENRLELMRLLDQAFRRNSAAHWRDTFNRRQMSADVIEDYGYPAEDASARRNRYLLELDDASLGPLTMLGFPIFMTDTPARMDRNAPRLGQHSAELLQSMLGLSADTIAGLVDEGVLA